MKMAQQRKQHICVGMLMLVVSLFVILMALSGTSVKETDITPVIFMATLGLYLIFSKNIIFR